MPLVRIEPPAASPSRLTAPGEAVHRALIGAFAIPADDFFQVLRGSSDDRVLYDAHYLGVDRDDDSAFIQVFLRSGRSEEQKRHFYRALADGAATAGLDPRNLPVVLTENTLAGWSFGSGIAQYLETPLAS